jgi:hypothetical protein
MMRARGYEGEAQPVRTQLEFGPWLQSLLDGAATYVCGNGPSTF